MLNQNSLAQLKGLKTQMEAEKEYAEAVVKGTQARYGFAVLDDGREVFIPPDEMLKVFPNDRIKICIRPSKDNKTSANIEGLVNSPLTDFTGRCVYKGKAVFVQPDLPQLSRWLFIPPKARNGVKNGDYVRCAVLRHPIRDGRPQAKVLSVIGDDDTPGIANLYCQSKHQLANSWDSSITTALEQQLASFQPLQSSQRRDLTDLEFVSIDAAKTQDIDDALYAEISSEGWTLYVAIADPTAYIEMDSELRSDIARRASSVYFHGEILPMLPELLSQDTCALSEGADRLALVCKISVSDAGEVGCFEFIEATVRSRAKLSYYAVDSYLAGNNDELMSHATPLESLYQVYRALREHRNEHELVMENRRDYRWILNDNKQIDHVEPNEKLLSQKLVEECMVACNRCAARFLSENGASGPFVSHPGFRVDRKKEAKKFLSMHAPDAAELDFTAVQGYRDTMRILSAPEQTLPLRSMVNRFLTRATLSTHPDFHMGMALGVYTNCTSPLRKYADFLTHLQIKSVLHGNTPNLVTPEMLSKVSAQLALIRTATQEAERWLASVYLASQAKLTGPIFTATVSHVISSGFIAQVDKNGLEGFVDLRNDPEKFSYDKWQASLTSTTRRFALEQTVEIKFLRVEQGTHQVLFGLVPDTGLKPVTEGKKEEEVSD
ncbi:MAG: VacB/RNase II family 3'-5' exoribonuclease [Halieaceae bacterium]|jgi:VacB/RNase II family 3'-5' exoribonuclease|nr:VacB/RNase II family 3'-5' exoribonuclease [Halieaceae bacterium]